MRSEKEICPKCYGKGEINFMDEYELFHLITCPNCAKANNKIGKCGKKRVLGENK